MTSTTVITDWKAHFGNFMLTPEKRREIASWSNDHKRVMLEHYRNEATRLKAELLTVEYGSSDYWDIRSLCHLAVLICVEITEGDQIPKFDK